MNFKNWRDTLSFGLCYIDTNICKRLSETIGDIDTLSVSLKAMASVVETTSESSLAAFKFCFIASLASIFPIIILLLIALSASAYAFYLPAVFISRLFIVALQALMYSHKD